MTTRTVEPPDGTILADEELTEAWVRDDEAAADAHLGDAHWYPMDQNWKMTPLSWQTVPAAVRNGVRLVVAEDPAEEKVHG